MITTLQSERYSVYDFSRLQGQKVGTLYDENDNMLAIVDVAPELFYSDVLRIHLKYYTVTIYTVDHERYDYNCSDARDVEDTIRWHEAAYVECC